MKAVFTDADLFALIPQRPPIVMVDLLQNVTESEAETGLLIKEDNIFVQNGQMQEPGLIEHIAQSAAAFAGFRGYASGEEPRLGYIGELKRLFFIRAPECRSTSEHAPTRIGRGRRYHVAGCRNQGGR